MALVELTKVHKSYGNGSDVTNVLIDLDELHLNTQAR